MIGDWSWREGIFEEDDFCFEAGEEGDIIIPLSFLDDTVENRSGTESDFCCFPEFLLELAHEVGVSRLKRGCTQTLEIGHEKVFAGGVEAGGHEIDLDHSQDGFGDAHGLSYG
jgi:hypothetical protein